MRRYCAVICIFAFVWSAAAAVAAERRFQSELFKLFPELKVDLARKHIDAEADTAYAKALAKFRLKAGARHDEGVPLTAAEVAIFERTSEPRRTIDGLARQAQETALQRDFVLCGLLDGEPGRISTANVLDAVQKFRKATTSDGLGALSDEERGAIRNTAQKVLDFARFARVQASPGTVERRLDVPSGLVETAIDAKSEENGWPTYSSTARLGAPDAAIRVHNPVHRLSRNTPLSMASEMLPDDGDNKIVWRRLYYNHLTDDDFKIETIVRQTKVSDGKTIEFVNNIAGWRFGGRTHGLKLTANLETLPPIAATAPVLPDPKRATFSTDADRIRDNWKRVLRAIWNELLIRYKEANDWRSADVDDKCRSSAGEGGRWIAVVYATSRMPKDKYRSQPVAERIRLESYEYFDTEPDRTLHFGCAYVWVPEGLKYSTEPYEHIGRGEAGSTYNKRATHFDAELQKIAQDFAVNGNTELELHDQLLRDWTRALLFVHGYNNSFDSALIRVAQLASAVNYKGRIYLFSWPGRDSAWSYLPSIDRAEQAEIDLRYFMKMILNGTRQLELDIVAHSMGAQILVRSLGGKFSAFDIREGSQRFDRVRLRHLIFAAPDVNNLVFKRKVQEFLSYATSVTVFASGCDGVIMLSKLGRGFEPRAGGLTGRVPIDLGVYDAKMQVIDVTHASGGTWCLRNLQSYIGANHAAFAFEKPVVEQIAGILGMERTLKTPPQRMGSGGDQAVVYVECGYPDGNDGGKGRYWVLADKAQAATACPYPLPKATPQ